MRWAVAAIFLLALSPCAQAQLESNNLIGFGVNPKDVSVSVVATPADVTSDTSTCTFNSQSFGSSIDATKVVGVAVFAIFNATGGTPTVSTLTVGGASAAKQVERSANAGSTDSILASFWTYATTSTSGNIVVTLSQALGASRFCKIIVFQIVGASSATASDTATDFDNSNTTAALDVSVSGGSGGAVIVAGHAGQSNALGGTITGTMGSGTQDTGDSGDGSIVYLGETSSPSSISIDFTNGGNYQAAIAAAFSP